jgi:hypothetical protein
MTNHRSRGGTENNPYPSDFYDCSSYTLAHQKRTHACSGHYIRTKALRELILETVRTASTFAITNPDEFMEKVRSASQIRQAEAAKETKRKLNKDRKRITELDNIIKKLYETFAVGSKKPLSLLLPKRSSVCPALRKILTVRSSSFLWRRSTPTFRS